MLSREEARIKYRGEVRRRHIKCGVKPMIGNTRPGCAAYRAYEAISRGYLPSLGGTQLAMISDVRPHFKMVFLDYYSLFKYARS
jgi:hypothetical protein